MEGKINVRFGEIYVNQYALIDSPGRVGIVVRQKRDTIEFTDGHGSFWEIINDQESKFEKVGEVVTLKPLKDYESPGAIAEAL
jgi:hypothetical protein